jgi:TonB family protein
MIDDLGGNPVARAIGIALLQFVWQGVVIAGATAGVLHHLRRHSANARYLAACLGLVSMLAAPVVTAATSSSSVNVDVVDRNVAPSAGQRTVGGATPLAGVISPDQSLSASISRFWPPDRFERQLPVIVTVWAFGVLLLALQLAGSWLLVERIRRVSTRPLARVSDSYLRDLAARINVTRRLRVAVSERVDVPTVIGWIGPLILVPSSAMAGLSPFQLEAIIAHEIAHIRRHDYVVNVLQSLVETLLFYHPGVWWISRQIRLERELCCDDVAAEACGDRIAYARALASLEELRADAPALALAANGGDLVTRIRRLLRRPQPVSPQPTWMVISLAVATVSLVFAGGRVGQAATVVAPDPTIAARAVDILLPTAVSAPSPAEVPTLHPVAPRAVASAEPAQVRGVTPSPSPDLQQVQLAERQLHAARMRNDVVTATQLLADEFIGTDQNGSTRNKAATLELLRTVGISSLSQTISDERVTNGMAVVTGSSVEENGQGTDRMLFTHVWRRDDAGWWKLVSSSQFRDPRIATPSLSNLVSAQPGVYGAPRDPQGADTRPLVALSGAQAVRVGGDIKEPKKILDVKPVYPQVAMAAAVQGIVIMEVLIDEQGGVAAARVLRSMPLLDQAAMDAVKQWRFTPTLLNGVAVQVLMTITVNFSLQ